MITGMAAKDLQRQPSEPALSLKGLRKVFRNDIRKKPQIALDDLTCSFGTGQCTGLLGHNGAGKTTTIRMILGLIRPDRGEILFEGNPLSIASKRFIGYMPEVNKLPAALTPEEILHHHLALFRSAEFHSKGARRQIVDELLHRVGLEQHRSKRIGKLSKGMGRRLAWAQAVIHKPRLLILDEPSSGLDPLGRREMLSWIAAEKTRGTSILLCTHELSQVHTLCEHFHILNRGKLVYSTTSAGGGRPGDNQKWFLHVSSELSRLRLYVDEGQLLPWDSARSEGLLTVLTFANYGAAAEWMQRLLADGLVVVRFNDETTPGEEDLLPYFKGDH